MKVFIMIEKYTNMFIGVFSTYQIARESVWYKSSCVIVECEVIDSIQPCNYCIEDFDCLVCGKKYE